MKLGKYFTLDEMLKTNHAALQHLNNNPPESVVQNLTMLVQNILDPLREHVGSSIIVTSGYRCPELNTLVGGSPSSQHRLGQAADIKGVKVSNALLFASIKKLKLPFDQLIWEYGTKHEPAWVHVSYSNRKRRQILFIGVKPG